MTRTELADAMLRGAKTHGVIEDRTFYLSTGSATCLACALGAALIGQYKGDFRKAEKAVEQIVNYQDANGEVIACAMLLKISPTLAVEVEHRHLNGQTMKDIADRSHKSVAETFLSVDALVMVDTSGSMDSADCENKRTRYDLACEQLI